MKRIKRFLLSGRLKKIVWLLFIVSIGLNAVQLLGYSKDYTRLYQDINENGFVYYDESRQLSIDLDEELKEGEALSSSAVMERYLNLMYAVESYNQNIMLRLILLTLQCFILTFLLLAGYFSLEIVQEKQEKEFQKQLDDKDQILLHYAQLSSVGEIAGNIIHQWKQPLNNLMLIVSNMQTGVEEQDYELVEELALDAREAVRMLSGTISDFKGLLEMEGEDLVFDVQDVVFYAICLFKNKLEAKAVGCEAKYDGNLRIKGRKSQLLQVLINLIDNAIDAVAARGIYDGLITVSCVEEQEGIRIRVRDNGGGIDPDVEEQIFQPYYTSKGSKGTGLGLTIARQVIARYFHGRLTVENEEEGAVFIIHLPRYGGDLNE